MEFPPTPLPEMVPVVMVLMVLAKCDMLMFIAAAASSASLSTLRSLAALSTYCAANWCFGSMRICSMCARRPRRTRGGEGTD